MADKCYNSLDTNFSPFFTNFYRNTPTPWTQTLVLFFANFYRNTQMNLMEKWKEVYGSENVWIGVSKKNGAWWTETDNMRIFYSSLFANGNGNYQDNCAFQRYVSRRSKFEWKTISCNFPCYTLCEL